MTFVETGLQGALVIGLDFKDDFRGHFARTFCIEEFQKHGLSPRVAQCNLSFNKRRGTLRGMHWQEAPRAEIKLVRVTRGAVYDVIVDLRSSSPTHLRHFAIELSADSARALYIPEGFAHGFQTLSDNTEVFYQMSDFFAPDRARGARWNDAAFGISWPIPDPIINERDKTWPDLQDLVRIE